MPIINVVLGEGRTCEQKRELCRQLTEAAVRSVLVQPEQVRVVIQETKLEHYAVGGDQEAVWRLATLRAGGSYSSALRESPWDRSEPSMAGKSRLALPLAPQRKRVTWS